MENNTDYRGTVYSYLEGTNKGEIMGNGKTAAENIGLINDFDKKLNRLKKENKTRQFHKVHNEFRMFLKSIGIRATPYRKDAPKVKERFKVAEITRRKCSDKLQPKIKVGERYFIVGRDATKNGSEVIILANLKNYSARTDNVPTIRCNASRFEWKEYTQDELKEDNLRKEVKHETRLMIDNLSMKEQMSIAFVPVIINQMAWHYAFSALACASRDKVSLLKKQSREVKDIHQKFMDELKKDLDFRHIRQAEAQTDMCIAEMSRDLTTLYFSVNNEFKRAMPDYPHDEMRTYAIISNLFIRMLEKWNAEQDNFLALRFRNEDMRKSVLPPMTERLRTLMNAFAGADKFNYKDKNVNLGMKVIENKIKSIEFSVI